MRLAPRDWLETRIKTWTQRGSPCQALHFISQHGTLQRGCLPSFAGSLFSYTSTRAWSPAMVLIVPYRCSTVSLNAGKTFTTLDGCVNIHVAEFSRHSCKELMHNVQAEFQLGNVEDGLLPSAFLAGLLIASIVYSGLTTRYNAFRMTGKSDLLHCTFPFTPCQSQ